MGEVIIEELRGQENPPFLGGLSTIWHRGEAEEEQHVVADGGQVDFQMVFH